MPTVLNALAGVDTINSAADYLNRYDKKVRPELFYNKVLLDTIRLGKEHFVHYGLAQTKPIQGKAEKLQLRRWSPLNAHTVPLVEGIPPKSDKGAMESWELGVAQYGRYMEFTDKVSWTLIDPIITHYTTQYAIVAVETLDLLAREALMMVPNTYYAGVSEGATSMEDLQIAPEFVGKFEDLRLIQLGFKKRLVKPYMGNKYRVICTPDFLFDMVNDPIVEKFMTINQTTKDVYSNTMIPDLFNMSFVETQHTDNMAEFTKIIGTGVVTKALRLYREKTDGTYEYMTATELDTAGDETGFYVTRVDVFTGDGYHFQHDELNAVPMVREWDIEAINTAHQSTGAAWIPLKVNKVLVVGKDCLIRTNVEGRDKAKMYTKPLGSAGVLDPIDQRQSIGFKIDAVGFGVERIDAVVKYICVPSQANA